MGVNGEERPSSLAWSNPLAWWWGLLCFLLVRGSSPALSHRSDGRKLVVGRVGSHQQASPVMARPCG